MPVYLNYAAHIEDNPVERIKLVIASNMSSSYHDKIFEKPLNPILGETYQCTGQDGAKIYFEQTCHHPPRSHYIIDGPNNNYSANGHLMFEIRSNPYSATVNCIGKRVVQFKDGQKIEYGWMNDYIWNVFMGTMGHQYTGKMEYRDEANNIYAYFDMGAYKLKA